MPLSHVLTRTLLAAALSLGSAHAMSEPAKCPDYLNTEMRRLHSQETANLCEFYQAGKPVVIVNTASHCGYTKQFGGLEALHQKYRDAGLTVLGFPSDSFKQEEKTEEGTAAICYQNYGVTFPMFTHVKVKGDEAHSVFGHLAEQSRAPGWNFNKYLIVGNQVSHYGSKVKPLKSALEKDIAGHLPGL